MSIGHLHNLTNSICFSAEVWKKCCRSFQKRITFLHDYLNFSVFFKFQLYSFLDSVSESWYSNYFGAISWVNWTFFPFSIFAQAQCKSNLVRSQTRVCEGQAWLTLKAATGIIDDDAYDKYFCRTASKSCVYLGIARKCQNLDVKCSMNMWYTQWTGVANYI